MSLLERAVTEKGDVDPGYLGMFRIMQVTVWTIPFMVIGAFIEMWFSKDHAFPVAQLGGGIAAACSGFAMAAGTVAFFRRMDNSPPPPPKQPVNVTTNVTQ